MLSIRGRGLAALTQGMATSMSIVPEKSKGQIPKRDAAKDAELVESVDEFLAAWFRYREAREARRQCGGGR